jgi:cytochrome P450 family 142 subfamily A polypeptide 1
MDIDLLDAEFHTNDPWAAYAWMRDEAPLYFDEKNELWAVSRYDDIVAVSKNQDVFTSLNGARPLVPPDPSMICQVGKEHAVQRGIVAKGFTPKHVAELEPYLRSVVSDLLDELIERGSGEIVEELAALVPMRAIGKLAGIPVEDQAQLLSWIDVFVKGGDGPDAITDEVDDAFYEFAEYHEEMVEARRGCPAQDLLSIWMNADIGGEKLDDVQLLFEHVLLLVGGSETTRNAISGGLEAMCTHPDQWEWLAEHPDAVPNASEEFIRWASPFVNMSRTLTQDFEMHGRTMKDEQEIVMLYPAANRDPKHFDKPNTFDVQRDFRSPQIAFGYGRHFCLGAALARQELRITLEEMLPRIKNLRITPGKEVVRRSSSFIRGLTELPLTFDPR